MLYCIICFSHFYFLPPPYSLACKLWTLFSVSSPAFCTFYLHSSIWLKSFPSEVNWQHATDFSGKNIKLLFLSAISDPNLQLEGWHYVSALLTLICWYFSQFRILDHLFGMLPSWLYCPWVLTVLSSLLYLRLFKLFIKWLTSVRCNSFMVSQEELSGEFCHGFLFTPSNTSYHLLYPSIEN